MRSMRRPSFLPGKIEYGINKLGNYSLEVEKWHGHCYYQSKS